MMVRFADLPPELIHQILLHLDTSDLLCTSRASRLLRSLSLDPLLHIQRLRVAAFSLSHRISKRPSRASISPPNAWIWLNRTNVLSRSISRSLVRIRLNHSLDQRPQVRELVNKAILPPECVKRDMSIVIIQQQNQVRKSFVKDRLRRKLQRRPDVDRVVEMGIIPQECVSSDREGRKRWNGLSPGLLEVRRKVIKESLKDGLRAWVERKGWREQKRREGEWQDKGDGKRSVKTLVRRLSARITKEDERKHVDKVFLEKEKAQARWGRAVEEMRRKEESRRAVLGAGQLDTSQPTRANVLGLKRFWEGVIKAAAG